MDENVPRQALTESPGERYGEMHPVVLRFPNVDRSDRNRLLNHEGTTRSPKVPRRRSLALLPPRPLDGGGAEANVPEGSPSLLLPSLSRGFFNSLPSRLPEIILVPQPIKAHQFADVYVNWARLAETSLFLGLSERDNGCLS